MQECPGGVCPSLQGHKLENHLADPLVRGFSCFRETGTNKSASIHSNQILLFSSRLKLSL